jgi:dynein heavy chain 1
LRGKKEEDWGSIRKIFMEPTFIPSIVAFDSKNIANKTRQLIQNNYMADANFNFEAVNRASKACGPLVKWIVAQMQYSEILHRAKPLRDEVDELEQQASKLTGQQSSLQKTIEDLEHAIAK